MKKFIYLFLLIVSAGFAFGQNLKVSVDKTTVGENERFQVYFSFEGGSLNDISNFRGPQVQGMRVLSGPNQSTNMQIINGRVSSSITYSYVVVAPQKGVFEIGEASIDYQGKTYKSKPIKIQVVQGSSPNNPNSNTGGMATDDLEKNVFIRAIPSKSSVYVGEQVTVEYKLYTKLNISSPKISKLPTYNGFWVEQLDGSRNLNFNIEMYNGERYRVATIERVALFPTKSGDLDVTRYELEVPVVQRRRSNSRDLFDDFFNDSFFGRSETIEFTAKSNKLNIKVKPLPTQGQPESFNGVVGNFKFNSSIDKNEVEVNEPVTLKINISGTGNIKLLELPEPKLPPGFEVYDPKSTESITRVNTIQGTKQIEYLIVPRLPGEKFIPPFEFSYFDPQSNKYFTFSTDKYSINVKPGTGVDYSQGTTGFSKEDVKLLNQDIRYIKTSNYELTKTTDNTLLGLWFWLSLILPSAGLFGFILFKKRQDKISGNLQLSKFKKAEKAAKNRLKSAKKELDAGNKQAFYDEISNALNGYLEDKLNIKRSEFSIDKALDLIKTAGINNELSDRVKSVFDKCEFARFAPKVDDLHAEAEFYNNTVDVIVKLENELSKKRK